ncbi:MAG TPA: phosphohistidine phosphatase [Planctomycetes bacterium]|nr:phosphohistidine phosphatase [Planctomycetota bacterium]
MKNLYIFRHGEAEDTLPPGGDGARALTPKGRKVFERAAHFWARILPGHPCILTSPLVRARETAEILASALEGKPVPQAEPLLTHWEDPLDLIPVLPEEQDVVLVGHMPHLGLLLGGLLTGSHPTQIPLSKGMGVWIRSASWTSGRGRLRLAVHQKEASDLSELL